VPAEFPSFVIVDGGISSARSVITCHCAGKTTFIRLLAGMIKPDDHFVELPEFNVSYKPQKISPKFPSTVRNLLHKRIRDAYLHPQFVTDVMKPMQARFLCLHLHLCSECLRNRTAAC
jgi:ATP-binding cassette, sub-family E, member 1